MDNIYYDGNLKASLTVGSVSDINPLNAYTKDQVNELLGEKSDINHTHEQYLTEHQDISHLASKEEFPVIKEEIEADYKKYTDDSVSALRGKSTDTDSNTVYGLANQLEELNGTVNALKNDTSNLEKIYGTNLDEKFLFNSIKSLSDAIQDGGSLYEEMVTKDEEVLNSAKSYSNSLLVGIQGSASIYTNFGKVETEISSIYDTIDNIELDIKGNVSEEYNTLEKIEDRIIELSNSSSNATTSIENMQEQLETLNAINTELETEIVSISEDLEKAWGKNGRTGKYKSIAELSNRLSIVNNLITGYSNSISSLQSQINSLSSRIEDIETIVYGNSSAQ